MTQKYNAKYPALRDDFDPSTVLHEILGTQVNFYHGITSPRDVLVHSKEEMMGLAIRAGRLFSLESKLNGRHGGPFGSATFRPFEVYIDGHLRKFSNWFPTLSVEEHLEFGLSFTDVMSWKLIGLGGNLVEPLEDGTMHAETVGVHYTSRAAGRNFYHRYVLIATTGDPCEMCAGALQWAGARWIVSGASIAFAVRNGFHEGLPPNLVQNILDNPTMFNDHDEDWITKARQRSVVVFPGVLEEEVVSELYRPYAERGGTVYNSGRFDPTG